MQRTPKCIATLTCNRCNQYLHFSIVYYLSTTTSRQHLILSYISLLTSCNLEAYNDIVIYSKSLKFSLPRPSNLCLHTEEEYPRHHPVRNQFVRPGTQGTPTNSTQELSTRFFFFFMKKLLIFNLVRASLFQSR